MQTLLKFKEFVDEIRQSASRKYKQEVLEKWKENVYVLTYLQFAFNPYLVFGISSKKLHKQITGIPATSVPSVFDLLNYLKVCNTGRDTDIKVCQSLLSDIYARDPEAAAILEELICKDLSIGCDAKSINAVIPGLIPTFDVQLANKYFDKPDYVEGKEFTLTRKIDGGRIIALKENGKVSFYTRAGQSYEGLVDLEEELIRYFPDNICLDGEITLLDPGKLTSKEQYKQTMKITRKDGEKHGIKMLVFDIMDAEEFRTQCCDTPYDMRRYHLEHVFSDVCQHRDWELHQEGKCLRMGDRFPVYFEMLPELYTGKDTSEITSWLDAMVAKGEEGIMINICDAPYEFKRTNNLLKVKKMNTLDLEIVGVEEGEGRLAGTLGAILVRYKDGNVVKVGSGFTDWTRNEIWQNQIYYIGKIAEIQYFEESKNDKGGISLRFPIFKDFRFDKIEADF